MVIFLSCIFVVKTKNIDNKMKKQFARVVLWLFLLGRPSAGGEAIPGGCDRLSGPAYPTAGQTDGKGPGTGERERSAGRG